MEGQRIHRVWNSMTTKKLLITTCLFLIAITLIIGCANRNTTPTPTAEAFTPEIQPLPAGLSTYEAMVIPPDNPMTPEKVALGRQLFFDERLSIDGSRSCYSCHVCEKG